MRQPRICNGAFSEQINRLSENVSDNSRWRQGFTPNLIINALSLMHLENARVRDATALGDIRALSPGKALAKSSSVILGGSAQKHAANVHEDCHKTAKMPDAKPGTPAGATAPSRGRDVHVHHGPRVRKLSSSSVRSRRRSATSPASSSSSSAPSSSPSSTSPKTRERRFYMSAMLHHRSRKNPVSYPRSRFLGLFSQTSKLLV